MIKHKILYFERDGVIQASLERKDRFISEKDDWIVGVGCDKNEARKELRVKLSLRCA